ncbi:hypothetical protein A4A49_58921, partial [Nicotiana attenuata]
IQGQQVEEVITHRQGGQEIVLANVNNVMQDHNCGGSGKESTPANINVQQSNDITREEVVADGTNNQQIQISNMFAVLEVQEDDDAGINQIVEVGNKSTVNPAKKLNHTAAVFTPKSTGIGSTTNKEDNEKHKSMNNEMVEDNQKDSTVAWVNRAFNANIVATNQSCQEVPSQATEIDANLRNINSVGNNKKDKQKQGHKPVTNMDGDGAQLIHKDVPPDKSKDLQLTEMQHEVRVENIGVSTSIQSCDMATAKGDIQSTQLVHKDQDKGNAVVGK